MTQALFSFGTLRQAAVQRALFGRPVPATPDEIVGYRVGQVSITDPAAIAASGTDVHPALLVTGDPSDVLAGVVLELTDDELAAAHRYEEASFERIDVRTRSGREAVAYVPRPGLAVRSEPPPGGTDA